MRREDICGVILVGGKSRRMGWDKAEMSIRGTRVLHRLVQELAGVADEILLAGREADFVRKMNLPYSLKAVPDEVKDRGPLAGVLSAMKSSARNYFLVIPCDMPFLSLPVFKKFADAGEKGEIVIGPDRGFPVLLKRTILNHLETALKKKNLCFFDVLEEVPSRTYLSRGDFENLGDPSFTFFNVNTPEDFELAEKLFRITWR